MPGSLSIYQLNFKNRTLALKQKSKQNLLLNGIVVDEILLQENKTQCLDTRFGVNLITRPNKEVISCISTIQNILRELEPEQYYYPLDDLHLTFFEVLAGTDESTADEISYEIFTNYEKIINRVKTSLLIKPIFICDRHCCALHFIPFDNKIEQGREVIKQNLSEMNINVDRRYTPKSAHITFLRYVRPLKSSIESWIAETDMIWCDNMVWEINDLYLSWGATWYGMKRCIQTRGAFPLNK